MVIFVMKALSANQHDYEIGYSFDLDSNHFMVEFFSEWDHHKQVPMHLIEKFREFHINFLRSSSGICRFYRRCTFCNRYSKASTNFDLDLKSGKIDTAIYDGLQIAYESFGLLLDTDDGCKVMHLSNFHSPIQESQILWFRSYDQNNARLDWSIPTKHSKVTVALVPFISKDETTKRVNNLLTFA